MADLSSKSGCEVRRILWDIFSDFVMNFAIHLSIFVRTPAPICSHSCSSPHAQAYADARVLMGEQQKQEMLHSF